MGQKDIVTNLVKRKPLVDIPINYPTFARN